MSGFIPGTNYDTQEKIREFNQSVDDYYDTSDDDGPDNNYECATCKNKKYIDDHKQRAPSWCKDCEAVKSFRKL